MKPLTQFTSATAALLLALPIHAQLKVETARAEDNKNFQIDAIPAPATDDLGTEAKMVIVDGEADGKGGSLGVLTDGLLSIAADLPKANFFFRDGTNGGRILLDLGKITTLRAVASYSWHPAERAAQNYKLYGSDGKNANFNASPKRGTDPLTCGWKAVAKVDTSGEKGGQHAAQISNSRFAGLGDFRYLLFDIEQTDPQDVNSNTFFSEIDVIDNTGKELTRYEADKVIIREFTSPDKKFTYVGDLSAAPDLVEWTEKELMPVVQKWYPKIIAQLPSKGYKSAEKVVLSYVSDAEMKGTPAWAAGNKLSLNADWFRGQLENEARGCVVHELTHVVQNYWRARLTNPQAKDTPGWITEGIPDYVRWFLYEPESGGARLGADRAGKVKYDNSYRISANFLDWVFSEYGKDILVKLNTAAREGNYEDSLWEKWTKKDLETLNGDWTKAIKAGKR